MKVGRKLATKLLNATKFVLGFGEANPTATPTEAVDIAMLARLASVVDEATTAFETYDYARALEKSESFFWWFCDDYVELVKTRAYSEGAGSDSARAALQRALSTLQRLFAPHIPFATEEVWSWWQTGSIHRASWPIRTDLLGGTTNVESTEDLLDAVCNVLAVIRRTKTEAKVSQRAEVEHVLVSGLVDLLNAGVAQKIEFSQHESEHISTTVRLLAQ
jgi:valyl-tRNA synthetase